MKKRTVPRPSATSIYPNQNGFLKQIFDRVPARKILCVALDFAKEKHMALCCDGNGEILKDPFPVHNSTQGVEFLCEQVLASARRRKISKCNIFFGGEDEASYVANFTAALRARQFLVMRVNAYDAKESRQNRIASTDLLDLLGIAHTLLSRRAQNTAPFGGKQQDPDDTMPKEDLYYQIRELSRSRRLLVRQQTAASNRIHALADQLFPGFLSPTKSGLTPFCEASIALMKERFSAPEIARRRPRTLADFLARHHVREPHECAAKLIALASQALPPQPHRLASLQTSISAAADLRQCLQRNADLLRHQASLLLLQTPYALLTSIPGIGFTLANGVAGELGDPFSLRSTDRLCSYAGIVPATFQTGGPDQPAAQGHTMARCNRILKDWVVQSAQKIHLYGPPELKERISRWNANGQHGIYAAARRYLRLLRSLVLNQTPYLEPCGRGSSASQEQLQAAAQNSWNVMMRKWRTVPGALDFLIKEKTPLGFWREIVMESRSVHLPLK